MFVLLLILIVAPFGFGFLDPLWWVAAAVLVYGVSGRSGDGGSDLGDYGNYRARRRREDRRDHERRR
ncbi:hypothetical protein [Streptomyces sp. NBC_00019]|uniref:hypothetical protein n=1 Tax=Streptomyces sp. NBC_00019 TaxID=2975623 RepID=UPI0032522372